MKIIASRPPNYETILAVIPAAAGHGVIFAYAPDIYVPSGADLPDSLIAHESVHIARQEERGVDRWWALYLSSMAFRYDEELIAHRAEYQALCAVNPCRQGRRSALKLVAKRLCSPLYGRAVTFEKAMADIREGSGETGE